MQFVTSGVPKIPQDLTKKSILALLYEPFDKIKDKLFCL